MKYDVFISYSRKDYVDENKQVIHGNIISQIKELFDANGLTYWFDEDGVLSGDAFAPIIARNIKDASIFLFISSKHSNASEWTSNEIATAYEYKKKIIPFRYDNSVYNDSVILYLARLDYIAYKSSSSKSLSRLLSSVQEYLKKEQEKQEMKRLEEERRRIDEISRQERATKLQHIREHIERLESRKYNLEKDILSQEKSLTDARNEKRIIESKILDLQEEEAVLLGHYKDLKSTNKDIVNGEDTFALPSKRRFKLFDFIANEWAELKSAMAVKHWIVNCFYSLAFLITTLFILFFIIQVGGESMIYISQLLTCLAGLLGLYRIIKNQRDGLVWLFLSLCWIDFIVEMKATGILATIVAYVLALVCLLIRKNKQSAWSLLQNRTKSIKSDYLFIAFIVIFILAVCSSSLIIIK